MPYNSARALQLLRLGSGLPNATFRDGQEEAIRHIVEGRGRLLVVQRTGWGKSFVYFIAAKLLREQGHGPTLLISPLLALIRNQLLPARRMGVRADTINSDNPVQWDGVERALIRALINDQLDVLLISPERLANERFRAQVLSRAGARITLLVIDEAHCISDWGHDFRPHYRLLERIVRALPPNLRLLATTATANDRVMEDLRVVLGPQLEVSRGDLNRPSLLLQTIRLSTQEERMAWLAEQLPNLPGSGIIYTLTIRDAIRLCDWLKSRGISVESYTGRTGDRRDELEQSLLENKVKALVATSALGMGYDKPDLAFVIHYQTPGSVVAYYQQLGRAGRALESAHAVLLSGQEDTEIIDYFIETAFPTRAEAEQVLNVLEQTVSGLTVPELMARLNISKGRIEKTIDLLSLESPAPIVKQDTKWVLTTTTLSEEFWQRARRLTDLRRIEREQMQEYLSLSSGHMDFLIRALDGESTEVHTASIPLLPTTVNSHLVHQAIEFLRGTSLPIEPRKKWPSGGLPIFRLKGTIRPQQLAEPGRALSIWGDAGWGRLVQKGKYVDGYFSDELIKACVVLVREWNPQPAPTWVTCIPSLSHPSLVSDFARRLSLALGLPFRTALVKTEARPEQKTMANSTQQARNVDGSLAVIDELLLAGPVLLVDDMVDSRWTLTVAAWLLRSNGTGEVWPLALAATGNV
jgi:ATP-dependent DNA helicase RecQ